MTSKLAEIKSQPAPQPRLQMTMAIWEQIELKKLVSKYGWEDYESMARDIKLNTLQRNANQLMKRLAIYKRLLAI